MRRFADTGFVPPAKGVMVSAEALALLQIDKTALMVAVVMSVCPTI
jgi:hypothetical protein